MNTNYSAQGSATIKRLRNGDTLYLTLEGNGIALFQSIDPTALSPTPSPSWKVKANQPELTPKITSARGSSVTLSNHTWKYRGTLLVFSGALDGDYTKDSTGKFEMNKSTGALRIISDLASVTNYGNEVLTYSCTATVGDLSYNFTRDRDITIVRAGAGTYTGVLTATAMQIGGTETSTIKSKFYEGTVEKDSYYIKWFKNGSEEEITKFRGNKSIEVTRDDVSGSTLFVAHFFANSSAIEPLARAAIRIIDNNDEYQVNFIYASDNRFVDEGKPVVIKGQIINATTNSAVTPISATWRCAVMDTQNWDEIRSVEGDTVTITTQDTDRITNGVALQNDIEVVASVDFAI